MNFPEMIFLSLKEAKINLLRSKLVLLTKVLGDQLDCEKSIADPHLHTRARIPENLRLCFADIGQDIFEVGGVKLVVFVFFFSCLFRN